jgi:hypothetical protein
MSSTEKPVVQPSGNWLQRLIRQYGRIAVGVHLAVYATFFAGGLSLGQALVLRLDLCASVIWPSFLIPLQVAMLP